MSPVLNSVRRTGKVPDLSPTLFPPRKPKPVTCRMAYRGDPRSAAAVRSADQALNHPTAGDLSNEASRKSLPDVYCCTISRQSCRICQLAEDGEKRRRSSRLSRARTKLPPACGQRAVANRSPRQSYFPRVGLPVALVTCETVAVCLRAPAFLIPAGFCRRQPRPFVST